MSDRCTDVRQALSARLDGEDAELSLADVDVHVRGCAGCTEHVAMLPLLEERVAAFRAAPVRDRTTEVLAAMTASRPAATASSDRGPSTTELRGLLALAAVVQVVVAVAALAGVGGHLARDLAALELATAGGLAAAAWRPWYAAGLLPVVAVGAAAGVVAALGDLVAGTSALGAELSHLVLLAATWPLVLLARRTGPSGTVRST